MAEQLIAAASLLVSRAGLIIAEGGIIVGRFEDTNRGGALSFLMIFDLVVIAQVIVGIVAYLQSLETAEHVALLPGFPLVALELVRHGALVHH